MKAPIKIDVSPIIVKPREDMRTYSFRITEKERALLKSLGGGDFLRNILKQIQDGKTP